ncbi:hypothetical protein Ddye_020245 [Dipteronia dyeriana]|uniref:U6 snRNA-associated Sm-like protein LSm1 n=1 Tax=Dipteronia dyeriana TaxID=168575 RepID=A0AAD9TZC9_9ROSI|nr:hypothetical protein Ddye_020245 [Dipteronia dyeriana]
MSWAGPDDVFLSTSLATYLDKKILVLLRDGRKLLGLLRSFDQFANVVLEGACERIIVGDLYCDIPLGLYVIRGENVVLIGELDSEKEELPPHMTRVSTAEIKRVSVMISVLVILQYFNPCFLYVGMFIVCLCGIIVEASEIILIVQLALWFALR